MPLFLEECSIALKFNSIAVEIQSPSKFVGYVVCPDGSNWNLEDGFLFLKSGLVRILIF